MLGTLAASYAGCDKIQVVVLFTIGMATMGFFYSSMKVNVMDLSPNYAAPAMALVNGVGAVAGIVSPPLIGYLIPNVYNNNMKLDLLFINLTYKCASVVLTVVCILFTEHFIGMAERVLDQRWRCNCGEHDLRDISIGVDSMVERSGAHHRDQRW